ncbi:helix-turn-helix transcriptional regulator [Nocardiopsis aegyptia]|uniref:helix-turn-helix transcriptional regulator n=1 Tax=Nocardiopsis aegyptia TaxID=220378 RepID=UPI003670D69B
MHGGVVGEDEVLPEGHPRVVDEDVDVGRRRRRGGEHDVSGVPGLRSPACDHVAAEPAVSRATLSRRFLTAAGQAPGAYLTQWRMDLAARRLRDTDDSLEAVAHAVGYTSAHAFNRAFSRARGQSPGRFRTAARESPRRPAA